MWRTMNTLGKTLLTLSAIVWGLAPLAADWGPSHVFHVDWPPHARVHTVWLLATGAMLSLFSVFLVWTPMMKQHACVRIGGLLGIMVLLGFFAALGLADLYDGAISDPEHEVFVFGINRNLVILTLTLVVQIIGTAMIWKPKS